MSNQLAIGINHEVPNEDTGVPTSFHTVGELYYNVSTGFLTVTLNSYFNRQVYEQGKRRVGEGLQYNLNSVPPRDVDFLGWLLEEIVNPDNGTPFAGAPLEYIEVQPS